MAPAVWSTDTDRLEEACGIAGVFLPAHSHEGDAARALFLALDALNHRRQESAGIAACDGRQTYLHKDMGLVAHNGNLTNAVQLRRELLQRGVGLISTTDTEVITQMLAMPTVGPPPGALAAGGKLGGPHQRRHGPGGRRLWSGHPLMISNKPWTAPARPWGLSIFPVSTTAAISAVAIRSAN